MVRVPRFPGRAQPSPAKAAGPNDQPLVPAVPDISVATPGIAQPEPDPEGNPKPGRLDAARDAAAKLMLTASSAASAAQGKLYHLRGRIIESGEAPWRENKTFVNRARRVGAWAVAGTMTTIGVYLVYKGLGAGLGASEILHHHENVGANLDRHAGTPKGNPTTGYLAESHAVPFTPGNRESDGNLMGGTLPEHMPKDFKLSDPERQWFFKSSTGSGRIGTYNPDGLTNDGTGIPGTVWNKALSGLKQLGYDPGKMSVKERQEYVQHVLDMNGLTGKEAKHLGSDFVVKTPDNADAIHWVTEATGDDGKPLLPAKGSVAAEHLAGLKEQLEDYHKDHGVGHAPAGSGHDGSGTHKEDAAHSPAPQPKRDAGTDPVAVPPAATPTSTPIPTAANPANALNQAQEVLGTWGSWVGVVGSAGVLATATVLKTRNSRQRRRNNMSATAPIPQQSGVSARTIAAQAHAAAIEQAAATSATTDPDEDTLHPHSGSNNGGILFSWRFPSRPTPNRSASTPTIHTDHSK